MEESRYKVLEDGEFRLIKVEKPFSEEEIWKDYLIYIKEWFYSRFSELTPPQRYSFKLIKEGKNVLISAPTGSGKTLSAFLAILDELYRLGLEKKLEDCVYCVYVSPLRALNNDIRRNLLVPLEEINRILKEKHNIDPPEIRVAVRTSDTTSYEKSKQLKKPPHILITTPESLAIVLNAPKFREKLKNVRWIIIDEIHELASSKRGVHLMLSVERLNHYVHENTGRDIQRIGLSATIHPITEIAKFLVGVGRECYIVDTTAEKPIEVRVIFPTDTPWYSPQELEEKLYSLLEEIIRNHRTTLIFTNTRSGTESVVWKLKQRMKDLADRIGAHHSSLSREIRLEVEEKLKRGEMKAVVCLPPDSKVLTENGEVEIKKLKNMNNVKIFGFDINKKEVRLQTFDKIIELEGDFDGYEITLEDNSTFVATKDHKVLVFDGKKFIFKSLEELKEGDLIVTIDFSEEGSKH